MQRFMVIAICVLLLAAVGTLVAAAQSIPVPWRLIASSDGTLWVITLDGRHRVTPATVADAELAALPELEPWSDGWLVVAQPGQPVQPGGPGQPDVPAAPPIALPDPMVVLSGSAPPRVGQTLSVGPPGNPSQRLDLAVNSVSDPDPDLASRPTPGRWVRLEWSITNRGSTSFELYGSELRLGTSVGSEVQGDPLVAAQVPRLDRRTIGPGELVQGFVSYAVPAGEGLTVAIFQPLNSSSFVVAELGR